MQRRFLYIFFLIILFSLTSCFDIVDKIHLKADGSGEYSLILNASKSKTRIAQISKMETINGKKVPKKSEIEAKVKEAEAVFKSTPGISNVKTTMDFSNYIIKLNCNFKNIENINNGLERLKAKKVISNIVPTELYGYKGKTFTRNKFNTFKTEYQKLSSADKEVFNNARYTSVMQFDNTIKSQSNSSYIMSPNKKALKIDGSVLDFILQKKSLHNNINLN